MAAPWGPLQRQAVPTCFGRPSQNTSVKSSDGKLASAVTGAVASGGLSSASTGCTMLASKLRQPLPPASP